MPAGLVAAYGFNEGAGTTVADASGSGNAGATTATTWTAQGRFGNALVFNGMSSWVTVPDAASLDLTSAMTLEAWVFPTVAPNGWRSLVSKEQTTTLAYFLYAGGPSRPAVGVFVGGAERIISGPQALAANVWSHVAATYDGAQQRLYVNGTQVVSQARTGAIAVSTGPLRMGGNAVYSDFFNGRIDEVRVYNRALTVAEIQADMNRPVP